MGTCMQLKRVGGSLLSSFHVKFLLSGDGGGGGGMLQLGQNLVKFINQNLIECFLGYHEVASSYVL